jgi:hypothetical protein
MNSTYGSLNALGVFLAIFGFVMAVGQSQPLYWGLAAVGIALIVYVKRSRTDQWSGKTQNEDVDDAR